MKNSRARFGANTAATLAMTLSARSPPSSFSMPLAGGTIAASEVAADDFAAPASAAAVVLRGVGANIVMQGQAG